MYVFLNKVTGEYILRESDLFKNNCDVYLGKFKLEIEK